MDPQNPDPAQVGHIMAAVFPVIALFFLVFQALIVVPLWIAMKKAGISPALSLIALIPTLGLIIALFILAFSTWKVTAAPEYAALYPGQGTPPAYPPVYAQGGGPLAPGSTNYTAPGAYTPGAPSTGSVYPPPPTEPPTRL